MLAKGSLIHWLQTEAHGLLLAGASTQDAAYKSIIREARRVDNNGVLLAMTAAVGSAVAADADPRAQVAAVWTVGYLLDVAVVPDAVAQEMADALFGSTALDVAAAQLLAQPCEQGAAALARVQCMVGSWCRHRSKWPQQCFRSKTHEVLAQAAARPAAMRALAVLASMAAHAGLACAEDMVAFVECVVERGVPAVIRSALAADAASDLAELPLRLTVSLLRMLRRAGGSAVAANALVHAALPGAVAAIRNHGKAKLRRDAAMVVVLSLTASPAAVRDAVSAEALDEAIVLALRAQAQWAAALAVSILLDPGTRIPGLHLPNLLGAPGRAAAAGVLTQWPPQVCHASVQACCRLLAGAGSKEAVQEAVGNEAALVALQIALFKHVVMVEHQDGASTHDLQRLLTLLNPGWRLMVEHLLLASRCMHKCEAPQYACCVCMAHDGAWVRLPCNHVVHASCIATYVATSGGSRCPYCRSVFVARVALPQRMTHDIMVQVRTSRVFAKLSSG